MRVLVTGGAGYLGSVLIPKLLARGHQVRVLDVGYFGVGHLRAFRPEVQLIREDIRKVGASASFRKELLDDCDCVIHLAAVSNDPSAELNPELTNKVNFQATCALAEAARRKKIRLLFSSSCSVYGEAEGMLDESGTLKPLTAYAISKVKAEKALQTLATASWKPVILRNGTLFGYSPRMRFDLVVNIFALYSTLYNEVKVFGEGEQWRPFLHVGDCARAFVYFAEKKNPGHSCYNIAHENLRVSDLAGLFRKINPAVRVNRLKTGDDDHRNYRVTAQKMQAEGFQTKTGVETGAQEVVEAIISGLIPDPESIYYRNAKWLKELTQIGQKRPQEVLHLMEAMLNVQHPPKRS